ncbi:MAG: 3'-5' exonuclease [Patescibacteria group bacterium]|jgi:DNA polymerase III epsilon subunit-like protein
MPPEFVIFDLETTGLKPRWNEIIEIGAIRVSADLTTEIGQFEKKVLPTHIETADPESLKVNGYLPINWTDAIDLKTALIEFAGFSKGGLLAGYNVSFDWMFLKEACVQHNVKFEIDYHVFDVFSVAWLHCQTFAQPKSLSLSSQAQLYALPPQPEPHTALADARLTLGLLQAVSRRMGLTNKYFTV